MSPSNPVAAVLYALLPFVFALLWASSYVAAKIGLVDATPFALVGARLAIAAAAAALLIVATGRSWPRRKSWPLLLLGGALLHGFGLAMTHAALVAVDATPTALVHAFHPILTAALGTVLLRERFASWQWLGVALGFVGVRARRAAVARHRQPGAAGAQPVRSHQRHAPAPAILRRRAAV